GGQFADSFDDFRREDVGQAANRSRQPIVPPLSVLRGARPAREVRTAFLFSRCPGCSVDSSKSAACRFGLIPSASLENISLHRRMYVFKNQHSPARDGVRHPDIAGGECPLCSGTDMSSKEQLALDRPPRCAPP